jgi:hypothetical protein
LQDDDPTEEILNFDKFVNEPESYYIISDVPIGATYLWRQRMKIYLDEMKSSNGKIKPYFVALKRINMTSSPDRVYDEISFIKVLK